MKFTEKKENKQLHELCETVRGLCEKQDFETGLKVIYTSMSTFPHAPEPHNLLGVILEKTGNHQAAMKHFRAAWALDPSYQPASQNLHTFGTFYSYGKCAFDEKDIVSEFTGYADKVYENCEVGRVVYRKGQKDSCAQ